MKTTAYVTHSDCSRHDTGWRHPEHQGRLPAVARAVYRDMLTLFDPLLELEARPATVEDLRLAHAPEYVEEVRRAAEAAERTGSVLELRGEVALSGASWDAVRAATGAALTGADAVLDGEVRNAFCAVRPPGHGAGRDHPGRFGLFNHVAVAARHLRERRGVGRVLVVEWSALPGRGTAGIVAADPAVRFVSVHQETGGADADWPPGATAVPVPAGSGGGAFADGLDSAMEAAAGFRPDFLLLSCGFDALAGDPLGGLSLVPEDYHALTVRLRERAEALCGGRLVSVLEGGYEPRSTALAVVQHLRALAGLPPA